MLRQRHAMETEHDSHTMSSNKLTDTNQTKHCKFVTLDRKLQPKQIRCASVTSSFDIQSVNYRQVNI